MQTTNAGRRRFLGGLAALPALALPGAAAALASSAPSNPTQPIRFDVRRGGEPIGTHTVQFQRSGDDLIVDVEILLEVRVAFVTVYRYRHTNREIWRQGRLISVDARTDDDGEALFVRASAGNGGLRVESGEGVVTAPADTLSTSYWNRETVRQSRLIDTQYGRVASVTSTPIGARSVDTPSGVVRAECWRVTGDLELDVCYADDGAWVGLDFQARGSQITYARTHLTESGRNAG